MKPFVLPCCPPFSTQWWDDSTKVFPSSIMADELAQSRKFQRRPTARAKNKREAGDITCKEQWRQNVYVSLMKQQRKIKYKEKISQKIKLFWKKNFLLDLCGQFCSFSDRFSSPIFPLISNVSWIFFGDSTREKTKSSDSFSFLNLSRRDSCRNKKNDRRREIRIFAFFAALKRLNEELKTQLKEVKHEIIVEIIIILL